MLERQNREAGERQGWFPTESPSAPVRGSGYRENIPACAGLVLQTRGTPPSRAGLGFCWHKFPVVLDKPLSGAALGTSRASGWDLGGMDTQAAGNLRKGEPWGSIQLLHFSRHLRPGRWPGKQSSSGGHEEDEGPVLHPHVHPIALFPLPSFWTETQ